MKQSVIDALNRVASLSAETKALVDQVKPKDEKESEQIRLLTNTIARLSSEVSILKMETIPNLEPLSDEDVEQFSASFSEYLAKSEDIKTTLLGFKRSFFLPYSAAVRVVIATTVLNYCAKNNLTVSDLWSDIVANQGYI